MSLLSAGQGVLFLLEEADTRSRETLQDPYLARVTLERACMILLSLQGILTLSG
jgi:hypothetical protein